MQKKIHLKYIAEMNNEIGIMIELQHFWDIVMKCELEIERSRKSIKTWESRLKELSIKLTSTDNHVKSLKLDLKKNELALEEADEKKKKLEQRLNQLKSEREIEAQNHEISVTNETKDKLESVILEILDHLERSEADLAILKSEFSESDEQIKNDIDSLNKKISDSAKEADVYRGKFDNLITSLSPSSKSRFSKLISSKDGVAIAKLNGEICSRCNFQIPSSLAVSASSGNRIEICTNCGRFIY